MDKSAYSVVEGKETYIQELISIHKDQFTWGNFDDACTDFISDIGVLAKHMRVHYYLDNDILQRAAEELSETFFTFFAKKGILTYHNSLDYSKFELNYDWDDGSTYLRYNGIAILEVDEDGITLCPFEEEQAREVGLPVFDRDNDDDEPYCVQINTNSEKKLNGMGAIEGKRL